MSDSRVDAISHLSRTGRVDRVCDTFEEQHRSGKRPRLERFLESVGEDERAELLRELLGIELEYRRKAGETPHKSEYLERFAEFREVVSDMFDIQANTVTIDGDTTGADGRHTRIMGRPLQEDFGDYELLEELGRGGMGVVYKARQKTLNRLVAVKLIRAAELAGDDEVKRFKSEAEAAGQLDHPGIVPVYEVGEVDGRHFFSMGYVAGEGLDERLKNGPLDPRQSASVMRSVADAVHFANDRGIVHRDLKPANVLIDSGGRPRVTDFGLAKRFDTDDGLSVTGQIMGTPGYMPPEQAEGKVNQIDARADVYSLGAMLYATLTGRPPFQAATTIETIRQVIDQEVIAPRQLNGAVPKDLETICLKCLQKNPHARYVSAEEVAGDLTRYLEGRPIVARPIGPLERTWRWCRRNRAVAALLTLVAVLLVLGTVGSTIAALQMRTARDRIADAKTAADAQRIKAQQAEAATIAEFEASTDDGIELLIGSKTSLSEQEKTYLERTLKRWQAFADRADDDERTLQIRADAHFRIGDLWSRLDRREEAMREYPRALEIRKQLVARFPDSLQHRRDLANALNNYGILLKDIGEYDRALEHYEEALRIRRQIVKQHPEDGDYKLELAVSFNNLGVLSRGLEQYDASQQWFEQAIASLHDLHQRFPGVVEVSTRLARAHQNLADVFFKTGQRQLSFEEYDKGKAVLAKLVSENPSDPELQRALASVTSDVGVFLSRTGKFDEAIKEYQAAREIQQNLVQQYPSIPTYRVELGRTQNNLGKIHHMLQQYDDALLSLRQALQTRLAVVNELPGIPLYDRDLARTYFNLGLVLASQSKFEEARDPLEQAFAIQNKLVDTVDNGSSYLQDVARTGTMLAGLAALRGDFAAARRSYQEALKIQRELIQRFPGIPENLLHCGATCWNIGTMCKEEGNLSECLTWADEAIDLLRQAHAEMGDDEDTVRHLKAVYILKADTLNALGRYQDSANVWQQAEELGNTGERLVFSAQKANSLVRAGQVREAVALADQLIKSDVWPAEELYNLACLYAVASVKINEVAELPADQRASMSKAYAGRALDMLKRIATKSKGFLATEEGRSLLATDEDLDVLRSRDDFRELAASVGVELSAETN